MSGRVWKFGDAVDTDVMAPGQYMKLPIEELATHCLKSVRPEFAAQVQLGDIIVAGRNFGVGSSREQAPQALRQLGIRAVLAESFAGIFYRNALNLGLVVMVCEHASQIQDASIAEVDPKLGLLTLPQSGASYPCEKIPEFLLDMVEAGGLLPYLKQSATRCTDVPA